MARKPKGEKEVRKEAGYDKRSKNRHDGVHRFGCRHGGVSFVRPKDWFDGNYFRMTASFSSVQGIKKGNEVRYAGVRVGEVSKISTEGNEGILEMRIKKDAQIPLDAEFTVSQSGVIGDYYVDIRGGHFDGSYFGEGMRVEEKRSNRLDQMMERAKKLMDSAVQMKENIGKMEGK